MSSLRDRLAAGPVLCAEGYLFEIERRGYLQAGAFVPEVVLDHPELVESLHREFVHAGSDVVEAFTYYAHREKLRLIGREHLLEPINRDALRIAGEVARDTGSLLAGDICNTNIYEPGDSASERAVRAMFEEQVAWAAEAGVDFVIAETFLWASEAILATEVIRAAGLDAVVTFSVPRDPVTREGWTPAEACRRLEDAGALVVGLNCARGPRTMLPLLAEIRAAVECPIAALPVPYRTHEQEPTMQSLHDPESAEQPFPTGLDPFTCTRHDITAFAREALDAGVTYLGLCCGAAPTTSARWPRRSGARRPPAATRPT
jgi:betaine-homocysteine S-methyltransferase